MCLRTVADKGARGAAHPKGSKDRHRAEAFEEALSIVSARLAEVAHEQAEALKAERLAMAQRGRGTGPENPGGSTGGVAGQGRMREHSKTTGGVKKDASSRSQGARRQAKRDSR